MKTDTSAFRTPPAQERRFSANASGEQRFAFIGEGSSSLSPTTTTTTTTTKSLCEKQTLRRSAELPAVTPRLSFAVNVLTGIKRALITPRTKQSLLAMIPLNSNTEKKRSDDGRTLKRTKTRVLRNAVRKSTVIKTKKKNIVIPASTTATTTTTANESKKVDGDCCEGSELETALKNRRAGDEAYLLTLVSQKASFGQLRKCFPLMFQTIDGIGIKTSSNNKDWIIKAFSKRIKDPNWNYTPRARYADRKLNLNKKTTHVEKVEAKRKKNEEQFQFMNMTTTAETGAEENVLLRGLTFKFA
jgi:hypothetical protein